MLFLARLICSLLELLAGELTGVGVVEVRVLLESVVGSCEDPVVLEVLVVLVGFAAGAWLEDGEDGGSLPNSDAHISKKFRTHFFIATSTRTLARSDGSSKVRFAELDRGIETVAEQSKARVVGLDVYIGTRLTNACGDLAHDTGLAATWTSVTACLFTNRVPTV